MNKYFQQDVFDATAADGVVVINPRNFVQRLVKIKSVVDGILLYFVFVVVFVVVVDVFVVDLRNLSSTFCLNLVSNS